MVELVHLNTNDTDITKYSIEFLRGNKIIVIKEFSNKGICQILDKFQFPQRTI